MASSQARKLLAQYPLYLNNRPVQLNTDLAVTNKYTGKEACRVAQADQATVDKAIQGAVDAAPKMRAMAAHQRKAVLQHVVAEMRSRSEEMAVALCIEAGKPIKDARGEVTRCIETFEIASEEATRIYGEWQPLDISKRADGYQGIVRKFPVGPCSFISPFNFPLNLAAHKIAPALAVGCPFVLKPASRTPIGALLIAEMLSKCDELPEGAFSVLPCSRDAADSFTTDERFKLVSFTGSPAVGWDIKSRAGKKKVVLELGGNAAVVVDEGTDLDDAVPRILHGAFYQSGQSCIGVQRIICHESLYDDLRSRLKQEIPKLKAGDPLDEETFLGPMITEGDAKRLESWTQEAVAGGAKVVVGGKRDGVFFEATIIEDAPADSKAVQEEAFGPLAVLSRFTDWKQAVEAVNNSEFGLQVGIFTRNIDRAFYAFEESDVGGVVINDVPSFRVDSQPCYGGNKDSGLGREGIRYAIEDMTELRIMMLRNVGRRI